MKWFQSMQVARFQWPIQSLTFKRIHWVIDMKGPREQSHLFAPLTRAHFFCLLSTVRALCFVDSLFRSKTRGYEALFQFDISLI